MKNAILLSLCLGLLASPASGLDVETGLVDVTFHISHPACGHSQYPQSC